MTAMQLDMKNMTLGQRVAMKRVIAKKKLGRFKNNEALAKQLQKQLQDA